MVVVWLFDAVLFAAGLALLWLGAELLVRGAARLAAAFEVPPLVIGLTVVSFATSMPEFVVSITASLQGHPDLTVGNVVGSNIFNLLAVMGPAALIAPLIVHVNVVRREVPVMIGVTALLFLLAMDGNLSRWDGALLFAGIIGYTVFAYAMARRERVPPDAEVEEALEGGVRPSRDLGFVLLGTALLLIGGRLVVTGAVGIASDFGISERVIALTVVAAGTGAPELVTTLVAVFRRATDVAVGNIVGSCVFNLMGVLGLASLIRPLVVAPEILGFDMPVMLLATLATLPIVLTAHRVGRTEGAILFAAYVIYMVVLLTDAPARWALS